MTNEDRRRVMGLAVRNRAFLSTLSERNPRKINYRWFNLRWKFRLLWCTFCGRRMPVTIGGILHHDTRGRLAWACTGCYHASYRRADS